MTTVALPQGKIEAAPAPQVELPRVLSLRDVVLFNIVAILSLRWTATAAAAGPSSLTMWVLAALLFFIPQGLAVSYLSARFPNEGGIYFWAKRSFGEGHGFLCGWTYWVNNILYYPNLLMSTAAIGTYVIGRGDTALMDNWTYIFVATLTSLWLAVWLNIVGLKTGRWLQNLGALGTYIPGAVLVGFGLHAMLTRASATPITWETVRPHFGDMSQINLWASIAFAYAGLELCAVLGGEVKDPRRTLPKSIYISAPFIAFLYIAGTASLLWLLPSADVHIVSGFFQAMAAGARDFGGLALADSAGRDALCGGQHRRSRRLAHRAGPGGVRDRVGPILPARLRPGSPAMEDALRRHSYPGCARYRVPGALGARQGHDRRTGLPDTARYHAADLFHSLSLPVHLLSEDELSGAANGVTPMARAEAGHGGDRDGRAPAHRGRHGRGDDTTHGHGRALAVSAESDWRGSTVRDHRRGSVLARPEAPGLVA